jgi:uncharacterized protein (TIGR03067 family)
MALVAVYMIFRPTIGLYRSNKGKLSVNDLNPEFGEFVIRGSGIEDLKIIEGSAGYSGGSKVAVGPPEREYTSEPLARVWGFGGLAAMTLPPGKYRIEAVGKKGEIVERWRVETSGLFSGVAMLQDAEQCTVEIKRGERVRISIANWSPQPKPPEGQPAENLSDRDRLQGSWSVASVDRAGEPVHPNLLKEMKLIFEGKEFRFSSDGSKIGEDRGSFTIDPSTSPKRIDMPRDLGQITADSNFGRIGPNGIYRFDGDDLILCMGEEKERPKEFKPDPAFPTRMAIRLQRVASGKAISIFGAWESSWGEVTLKHEPQRGDKLITFTGEWKSAKSFGEFQKGVYDPKNGTILARYLDEATQEAGTVDLRLVFDGKALVGLRLAESGALGGWSMWRKGEPRPDRSTRSIAGEWDSDRGRVTLNHGPIGPGDRLDVTGYLEPQPGKRVEFHDARINPNTGILTFATKEDETMGTAQLMLSPDGQKLEGGWADTRRKRGNWTLTRRTGPNRSPAAIEELRRLVTLQEQETARANSRFKAGLASAGDLAASEIELLEIRIRLASAEEKRNSVIALLKELQAQHEKLVDFFKKRVEAGADPVESVNKAEKNLTEVRIRLRNAEAQQAPKPKD